MRIEKDVSIRNGKIFLLIRVVPSESEKRLIEQFKLRNYKRSTPKMGRSGGALCARQYGFDL